MLTHSAMQRCGLTSLVVCINDKFCDIRERNVTIRSEIWTMSIHSLGVWNIRECVTLWSLGCITCEYRNHDMLNWYGGCTYFNLWPTMDT
jgi:hypothetical protein